MTLQFPVQPMYDRVFVVKDDASVDKATGFHLPDTVKGRAQTGTVVAVGEGYYDTQTGDFMPLALKVGDRVLVKEFDGYIIRFEDQEFFVFSEKEIIGKLAA